MGVSAPNMSKLDEIIKFMKYCRLFSYRNRFVTSKQSKPFKGLLFLLQISTGMLPHTHHWEQIRVAAAEFQRFVPYYKAETKPTVPLWDLRVKAKIPLVITH
jgi:hypothetical protein